MASYTVTHTKPQSFYDRYLRKTDLQHQTHYCPGCGHGVAHKLIARAIDELGIQDRTIFISPVGCAVFAYYYFDVGNIQAAHGRAAAVATAAKRARPESIVIDYQGDGDLAAIGLAEIIHAANRGENLTVFFINNAIYGMTGGQMAPTTLIGQKTTTSPWGRDPANDGYPLRMCELLATLEAPVYLERVALADNKQVMKAARAVRRALENQVRGLGFSLVEILSSCPTIWKMTPVEAQRWVGEEMVKVFPLGVFRDHSREATPRASPPPAPPAEEIPKILGIEEGLQTRPASTKKPVQTLNYRIKVAGFGGQGVLLLGQLLAEAGLEAGLEVSWLPSYGPEMRSGTSHCHVRLATQPVDSPLVSRPNVLLALNEPSLRKFLPTVVPGGWAFYNGEALPADCSRNDVRFFVRPFTQMADELGEARAGNIVMLGALLELIGVFTEEAVLTALERQVKSERWLAVDRRALLRGREAARARSSHEH
ncbi:MAG: 2-oxoacid:acceptor oxidoreductase family protein [Acidobacteria bacterium]|nr:2-oxoacid:acceptor oxidoreductase family protein [Acidobacteriota bacterium]